MIPEQCELFAPPAPTVAAKALEQGRPAWDVCRGRHGGNLESEEANRVNALGRAEQLRKVLAAIQAAGPTGITCKELAQRWGVGMNTISGRFSELKAVNAICRLVVDGQVVRRDGSAAYWLAPQYVGMGKS